MPGSLTAISLRKPPPKGNPRTAAERPRGILAPAKMAVLDQVQDVREMAVPPSNRLHKLSGDRAGQWSVSTNKQWRLSFGFDESTGDAHEVELNKHYE